MGRVGWDGWRYVLGRWGWVDIFHGGGGGDGGIFWVVGGGWTFFMCV